VECANHLPAGLRSNNKERDWFNFQVRLAPDFSLQAHALVKLIQRFTLADDDSLAHRDALTAGAPLLARSQSSSISERGTSASSLPLSPAMRSISLNLAANLAFAFLRATSGST